MRKTMMFALAGLSVLLAGGTQAQKKPMPSTMDKMAPTGAKVSMSGLVRGLPAGTTFTLAMRHGDTTVDVSKGRIFNGGKFFSIKNLTPGSMVTAVGAMTGTTLYASKVTVTHLAGSKAAPKMGRMMKKGM